eukprot:scaffold54878_cov51-Attheya_sp.AAC.1
MTDARKGGSPAEVEPNAKPQDNRIKRITRTRHHGETIVRSTTTKRLIHEYTGYRHQRQSNSTTH